MKTKPVIDELYKATLGYVTECLKQLSCNKDRILNPENDIKISVETIMEDVTQQPAIHAYYASMRAICVSCVNECTKTLELVDGELYDFYKTSYEVKLSSTEVKHYITHDGRHRELTRIIVLVEREMTKITAILDAVISRGYALNNMVKIMQIKQEQVRLETPIHIP